MLVEKCKLLKAFGSDVCYAVITLAFVIFEIVRITDAAKHSCFTGHKKLHPSYWYNNLQNYAVLWQFLALRCTRDYPITCLFDILCKIEN